jgi:class 3 adenylate cyclase/tetratricopeptide (TPR) repeat protein
VTALFCDLVGFTPLSEQLDPEEVRDVQAEYFAAMSQQIDRYGGTVEKYAGDAVLALFGAPIAHEDDAERAVLCALGMQAAIEPVAEQARRRWDVEPAIRVGVNTGEVVSGIWEAGGRQDVAVTGDAVNTAARIQATAEPGEVLVGEETMRLTQRRIIYGEPRDLVLKGKAGSVPGYPAMRVREEFGERWEGHITPLVGRDRELSVLLDAWNRAQRGEGQLVTLVGDPGVGKSRLVTEVIDRVATSSAVRVVRARCLSYGQEISLWLVGDFLRRLFGIKEQDALDRVQRQLTAGIALLLARCDQETRADASDVLGEVLGLPPGNLANAGAQIRRQMLNRILRLLFGALAERAPSVVVLEDLHWIDAASQEVLGEILADLPGLRLLVLAAQRPGSNAPWSEWGWPERLTLRALEDEDAAVLAGAVLGGMNLSPNVEQYVAERAGGNPFFVEELLRALQEAGGLVERGGQVHLVPGAAERLPSTLTEVLLARLDRLESQVRSVAQVASVIGRSFAVRLLAQVMEREQTALEMPLTALQRAEIAFPRGGSDLEYVFKHVSMREVAYNTLVQKRRQQLHLATARAIAQLYPSDEYVEMIAYHYGKTEEHAEAAEWLERAADRAAAIYANESASNNYEEARRRLELCDADEANLARIDEKLAKVLMRAGDSEQVARVVEHAVDIYRRAGDLEGVGRATALSPLDAPEERIQEAIEQLQWSGPSSALAALHVALAGWSFAHGKYPESLAAAEQAAKIAQALGDERALLTAEGWRCVGLGNLGSVEEALAVSEGAIPRAESLGAIDALPNLLNNASFYSTMTGRVHQGTAYAERTLEVVQRIGDRWGMGFMELCLAEALMFEGDWDRASACVKRAEDVYRAMKPSPGTAWASSYVLSDRAWLDLWQGRWEEASRGLHEALPPKEAGGDIQGVQGISWLLGELELLSGQPEAARTRLERITSLHGIFVLAARVTLAWAYLELGDVERAAETAIRAMAEMRDRGIRVFQPDALRVRGMLLAEQGKWEEAERTFEEAVSLARAMPYPYAQARALNQHGMTHVQKGEPQQARSRMEEALALFQRLGAGKDVERTEQALAALR